MTRHWDNIFGLTIAAGLSALTGAAAAADIEADDGSGACHVAGNMTVHDDETRWALVVSDLQAEGDGCYARIVIERSEHSDSELRSFKTHAASDDVAWDGVRKRTQTTGATLYACIERGTESDDCSEIYHVEEN